MARALARLLGDDPLRLRMGAKSLELIVPHDHLLILDQWEALYQRLVKECADRARGHGLRKGRTARRASRLAPARPPISSPGAQSDEGIGSVTR